MAQGKKFTEKEREEVVQALEPYFKLSYGIDKACSFVGFPPTTFKTWMSQDIKLRLKVIGWQNEISILARRQWQKNILEGKPGKFGDDDYTPSKEWLERKDKDEFSTRSEIDHQGEISVVQRSSVLKPKQEENNEDEGS